MQPSIYGPYPYLPISERKPFAWPGGAKLALWVIPNIEFFHLDDPMPGVNNERLSGPHVKTPNVRNWALRDYGNRVGVWRFFDVLARHGIRATAALNSDICEHHPQIIRRAVELDWEFMGHCQTNARRLNELPADQERQAIRDTLSIIGRASGRKVTGWLGAGLAETWNTLDYLIDEGVQYVADWTCDDLPFRMSVGGRGLFSIPYSLQVNDTTQFYNQKATFEDFEKLIKAQFDCLYGEAGAVPRVMAIAIHPFVSGVPHWIGALDRALSYILAHDGVWRATGSEIIAHYAKAVPDQ
jgi:peptidoglycan/xylan/chitin deacetylase (PgdA/CDA1 family)